jgi:phosphoglucosamine mutase
MIENHLDAIISTSNVNLENKDKKTIDVNKLCVEFYKNSISLDSKKLNSIKVAIDCAHGATYKLVEMVFKSMDICFCITGNMPNGININEDCGSTSIKNIQEFKLKNKADIAFSFDGDGDRIILIDEEDNIADGDDILYILTKSYIKNNIAIKSVVGTTMSNSGLEIGLEKLGVKFHRSDVGDKFVVEKMKKTNSILGGETSGHIICNDLTTSGDSILIALKLLEAKINLNKKLSSTIKEVVKTHNLLDKITLNNFSLTKELLLKIENCYTAIDKNSRVVVRKSGTEIDTVRVMVEGFDLKKCQNIMKKIKEILVKESNE